MNKLIFNDKKTRTDFIIWSDTFHIIGLTPCCAGDCCTNHGAEIEETTTKGMIVFREAAKKVIILVVGTLRGGGPLINLISLYKNFMSVVFFY